MHTVGWGAREFDKASNKQRFSLGFWAQFSVSLHTRMHIEGCPNILDIAGIFKIKDAVHSVHVLRPQQPRHNCKHTPTFAST